MPTRFVILSGTSLRPRSETARSATEALELVRAHMRLRHPGLIVQTGDGEQLSFFQLKDLAQSETLKQNVDAENATASQNVTNDRYPSKER